MTDQVKEKIVNVEDMQSFVRKTFNKGIGSDGTCTTAAATAAKEVTVGTTFRPVAGATLLVTFQNAITAASATLAVTYGPSGDTTTLAAKPIYYRGAALPANVVKAGDTLLLRYDGTCFKVLGHLDTDTDTVTDLTYDTTNKKLKKTVSGTQSDVVTAEQIVADGGATRPLDIELLPSDYVFKPGDSVVMNGVLYRCTEQTENTPFTLLVQDGKILYNSINGQKCYMSLNTTLNSGWEKKQDLSDRFYVEQVRQEINQAKQDKLTFDGVPTSGSSNPVTSNGIHSALYNLPWKVVKKESVGGSAVTPGDSIGPGVMIYITNITTTNNLQLEYTEGVAARWNIVVTFGASAWFYLTYSRSGLQELLSLQGNVDVQSSGSVMIEVYFDGENFYYDMFVLYKA